MGNLLLLHFFGNGSSQHIKKKQNTRVRAHTILHNAFVIGKTNLLFDFQHMWVQQVSISCLLSQLGVNSVHLIFVY